MADHPDSTPWQGPSPQGAVSLGAAAMDREDTDLPASIYDLKEARDLSPTRDSGDLFSRARMQWQFGDWDSLRKLDLLHIEYHPDRAELALLAGCAALQVGEREQARTFLASSIEWGCNRRLIFRLLAAGVYNGLGRYHALMGNGEKEERFFQFAGRGMGGDPHLIGDMRRKRELLALPQVTREQGPVSRPIGQELEPSAPDATIENGPHPSMTDAIAEAVVNPGHSPLPGIHSYAQNLEDVMLWRALGTIDRGFYIDVGAQHPVTDSVSKAFYDRGWRGIHVEATRAYANLLRENRPDESVIEAAVSDHHGSITFYETDTGLSTGDPDIARMHRANGFPMREVVVPTISMDDVFGFAGSREIHWLKIDVEGMEAIALQGWRSETHRPWVVVVESSIPCSRIETSEFWEHLLFQKGYCFAYFDGLSRFYVAGDHAELIEVLKVPPNTFDGFVQVR